MLEKWTNKDGTIEEGFAVRIKREIATYQIMSGSLNVCCFYGAYESDKHLYLVTELCTGASCRHPKAHCVSHNWLAHARHPGLLPSSTVPLHTCHSASVIVDPLT